ncbi:MAG TPA: YHS domain-containing protein [Nitrospirae bacterium]|nr:NADH dehydrogenase [bacterium BMS3Abin10]HDO26017.1 YHS domain-containing protein [Nitrospirota bacterium]HDZ88955.1 YHS domain-containing protein [Nitrospirota bacterium]
MEKDPICNMDVDENEALTTECDGKVYYFCSEGCRDKFLKEKTCKLPCTSYDLIIVGGGPGGLTAAVYAATLKMDAFLITRDLGGQAIDSTKIENYMGYDFITGPELIGKFQYQLIHSRYIDHLMSDVEKIEPVKDGFSVTTSELKRYFAKTLIIATGMSRRRLKVPGEEEFQRKGVFYGNIQDLPFMQGEDAAVIGGGNSALQIVENLHTVAENIYLVSDSELKADPVIVERVNRFKNLKRYEGYKVTQFTGENTLSGISIRKKAKEEIFDLPVKGVFIAIGLQPNSSLVSQLSDLNEKGEIVINPDCSTSFQGIFAVGDVTNAFGKRIIIASGEGAKAALAARQYILNLGKK